MQAIVPADHQWVALRVPISQCISSAVLLCVIVVDIASFKTFHDVAAGCFFEQGFSVAVVDVVIVWVLLLGLLVF